MLRLSLILTAFLAQPLAAQSAMSAEAFESYTKGKTLFYGNGGEAYGVERYLEDRRVVWSFLDGECKYGSWYEQAGQICFVYDDRPGDPQCWTFRKSTGGLIAQFENNNASTELYEAQDVGEEMICYGPDVGV